MIPPEWIPHRRQRDQELVGYLVPRDEAVVPVTLFGYRLAGPVDVAEATRLLDTIGLAVLANSWQLELADGGSIRVKIREVSTDRLVVVSDDFGYGGNMADAILLDVPEPGRLSWSSHSAANPG
jgi:hypothetical protein